MAGHLISRDELLAAGALDVPPEWRKSLQAGCPKPKGKDPQRELFADLGDAEEQRPVEAATDQVGGDEDAGADEAEDEPS
jgi:hypothetical protein